MISPYNHGNSKCERQIRTISKIIMKHLWDKGQMWPFFATTAAYAMNTFASEALSGLSPFQLVLLRDPPNLTSLSFPKIDTIPVKYREYYNLLLARAQLVGSLLLEWRTKQVLEYESRTKRFRNEEIFQDNQMVYLLALHASALQTNTTKFKHTYTYETALKNTLLNKFAIKTPNNKLQEVTLQDGSKEINYLPGTIMDYVPMHG